MKMILLSTLLAVLVVSVFPGEGGVMGWDQVFVRRVRGALWAVGRHGLAGSVPNSALRGDNESFAWAPDNGTPGRTLPIHPGHAMGRQGVR